MTRPTKRQPHLFSSLASASLCVIVGCAGNVSQASGNSRRFGACCQKRAASEPKCSRIFCALFALFSAASTLPRFRTMSASYIKTTTEPAGIAAARSISKPSNALRKASRFLRIVIHDRLDWNPPGHFSWEKRVSSATENPLFVP